MSADLLIANLLRIAMEDLDGALLLASRSNRNAVYLCEQAAEKVIRAILSAEGKHAGIKHRLDEMVDLVPDENPLKPALREIEELAAYATAYRYPTSSGRIPDAPTGGEFGALAKNVEAALGERSIAVRRGPHQERLTCRHAGTEPLRASAPQSDLRVFPSS